MIETSDKIIIYQPADGLPALEVYLEEDTVWLTQRQISALFETERSIITKHIHNIFNSDVLNRNSVCAKFALSSNFPAVAKNATAGKIHLFRLFNKNN